jgi:hypothetical protein
MTKLKNFIANLPLYAALFVSLTSDKLFLLSLKLHITFNTEFGAKLKELDEAVKKLKEVQTPIQGPITVSSVAAKKASNERYSKLANIIKGSDDGSGNSNG